MFQLSLELGIKSSSFPSSEPSQIKDRDCWQTPKSILKVVRLAFEKREIVTDPCTTHANPTGAKLFFTPEKDGLTHIWKTNAFVNPPYSNISPWLLAINESIEMGEIKEAIALLPAGSLGAKRSGLLSKKAQALCLWRSRIAFVNPITRKPQTGTSFTSAFLYWGEDPRQFKKVFDPFGIVGIMSN